MRVLLTGGAGFIGSHVAVVMLEQGHEVVVLDDLSNSSAEAIRRVGEITGRDVPFVQADAADAVRVGQTMAEYHPEAVVHLAGLKAVGESVQDPLKYYAINLQSAVTVLNEMQRHGVRKFVFSSSATVYEEATALLRESDPTGLGAASPYGRTKAIIEQIILDTAAAQPDLQAAVLRYFNPVGAHGSGRIGESPRAIPNNLLPYVAKVAVGAADRVGVFGDDYPTPDGTGVRDYIHVLDLAEGHLAALTGLQPGVMTLNLGTGVGASVLEVVDAFSEAVGRPLPIEILPPRDGDVAIATADPQLALKRLGWRARRTLREACADSWRWQQGNPEGYPD